ncbi:PEGA domain-containing protein [Alcaligenes sp. SDU_A2]|uniref:PEGA domain-containing protein n=1 Tax=Alcaligenes sp. SDU_A2 TaxID=3136634 RepID=UPI00311F2DFF
MTRSSSLGTTDRPLSQVLDSLLHEQRQAVLAQVAAHLRYVHDQQQWYGALGLDTVVLTDAGQVRLLPPEQCEHKRSLAQSLQQGRPFDEPCAAPEQYVQDPLRPPGPWSDVYAYAALSWHLLTGRPVPAAPWRQLSDPIAWDEEADGSMQAMLRGLSLDPTQRPQSMSAYAKLQALGERREQAFADTKDEPLPVLAAARRPAPLWLAGVMVLVVAGLGAAYLFGTGGTSASPPSVPVQSSRSGATEPAAVGVSGPQSGAPARPEVAAPTLPEPVRKAEADVVPGQSSPVDAGKVLAAQPPVARPSPALESVGGAAPEQGGVVNVSPPLPLREQAASPAGQVEQLEPVAAKPAPPPAKGTVVLDVRPWGEVYVNGRKHGVSPPLKSLSLAPGSHRIVIKNAELPEYSTTVQVRSGRTASVSYQFR